jgi:amino acid adenylation domain-containing protein
LEPLIGYFVNALPLRTKLDGAEMFSALLGRVRTATVDALGNQDTPLESLVQRLKLERDTSRTPLYSAFFSFQDVRNRKSSVGELSYEQIHVHAPVSPTDLSFWVKQLEGGVAGGLDYATDLFDEETIGRWLESFRVLLEAIADGIDLPLSQMPFLAPREREALAAISRTERPYPTDLSLHQLIEAQVDRTPDAIAVVDDKVRLSYSELDQRANRLAHALQELGAGPGRRVGICLERGAELLVAALAVMKSGAAYVPLDPAFPAERLSFMADDAELGVIILESRTKERAPQASSARVLQLDMEQARLATLPSARVAPPSAPHTEAPAYVIYTSGSTGRPKGVILPHRSVVNFVTSMVREPGLSSKDRLLAVTTLSFDIAVLELYAPLIVGARVVVASREVTLDGDLLGEAIESNEITVMQATPSTWRLLLATGFRDPSFKALCGGEAFPGDLADQLLNAVGEVWNMYGPTETTVWSTCKRLEKHTEIRIGRPIANTTVHVVDANGQLAPWGSVGELWIGGLGVALGYLARPELTRERFIENPFAPGMAYRTGDLVRLRSGGELAYLRRNDNQIKLRGYRIELGEIEVAIAAQPGVAEAVAVVREDRPGDQRLVAYLVVRSGAEVSEANLRTELRVGLPEYMIPQHFVVLDRLPLTPNGKVDRKLLPSPSGTATADETYVAPSTDKERMLAEMWQEILNVPRVSARDNFFDIGGHSLLCLQMTVRIEQLVGVKLNPRIILRNNLSQVAALLEQGTKNPESIAPPPPSSSRRPGKPTLAQKLFGRFTNRSS